jgi:hypothetical protein
VLSSWRSIADHVGEEGADIAVDWFLDVCRVATSDAAAEARLSPSVFAAYWPTTPNQRQMDDVMRRWFPMEVKTPTALVPIEAAWSMFEASANQAARDLFDLVSAAMERAMADLPAEERHEPFARGWDGQVG